MSSKHFMAMSAFRPAVVALASCLVVALSGANLPRAGAAPRDARPPAPIQASDYAPGVDRTATDTARFLAGLPPSPASRLAQAAARPEWRAWQQEFDAEWNRAASERFSSIAAWRERDLDAATGACQTLVYPFAGPDILNALLFFPDCQRYVMFGLEQPGTLPDVGRLSAVRLVRLLDETRQALNDLLERNYFITSHMRTETAANELRGTLPLMAVILARMNAQLVSLRAKQIDDEGQLRAPGPPVAGRRVVPALEIVFTRSGRQPQTIVYFRAQAQDAAIRSRPGVLAFLGREAPHPTFLKSASYLLHGNDFAMLRGLLLKNSRLILEDDSGIPLRFLNSPEWTLTFYGKYDRPVRDFNYGYQPDMAEIYQQSRSIRPLPFSFGYHWRDGASSVILAVKNQSVAAGR